MGRAVEERADVAIVTTDNPRHEDPRAIAAEILAGFETPSDGAIRARSDRSDSLCPVAGRTGRLRADRRPRSRSRSEGRRRADAARRPRSGAPVLYNLATRFAAMARWPASRNS